jgi:hypothetical protein
MVAIPEAPHGVPIDHPLPNPSNTEVQPHFAARGGDLVFLVRGLSGSSVEIDKTDDARPTEGFLKAA